MSTIDPAERFDKDRVEAYIHFDQGSFSWRFIEAQVFTNHLDGIINSDTRLLDVACGTGRITNHLKSLGLNPSNAYGIDISTEMVAEASRRVPEAHFELADVLQPLPYENNFFDVAVTNHLHQFFDDEELKRALKEIARVLRPGGMYLFIEPNPYQIPHDPLLGKLVTNVHTPFGKDIASFRHDYYEVLPRIAPEVGFEIEQITYPEVLPSGEADNPEEYQRYSAAQHRICLSLRKL